jgi:hypothetical protein
MMPRTIQPVDMEGLLKGTWDADSLAGVGDSREVVLAWSRARRLEFNG